MSSGAQAERVPTRAVRVGDVEIGGENPIRVQSMTTANTRDVDATAAEIERLVEAGCEIVRVTTPAIRDVECLAEIRERLACRGLGVPLVADVHFAPDAAMRALDFADKVRINPGNFVDRKRFEVATYSDAEYAAELERVGEAFRPLVDRAKTLGRALRIGTNHGSLSDRIVNRFGDSPTGMVESALEFLDVCEAAGFEDVVFSMKASNPAVMIAAYRLLTERLLARADGGPIYPLHLGVTEAGSGRDGRIKSAIGIGSLLAEGLGDTVRVSLTEDPVREIPVARALVQWGRELNLAVDPSGCRPEPPAAPLEAEPEALDATTPVRVDLEIGAVPSGTNDRMEPLAVLCGEGASRRVEGLVVDANDEAALDRLPGFVDALRTRGMTVPVAVRSSFGLDLPIQKGADRLIQRVTAETSASEIDTVLRDGRSFSGSVEWMFDVEPDQLATAATRLAHCLRHFDWASPIVSLESRRFVPGHRALIECLSENGLRPRLALRHWGGASLWREVSLVRLAADFGTVLGLGDVECVSIRGGWDLADRIDLAYRVLQGARLRMSRAEFISCPGCGRTQFDLQEVSARIERRTGHLPDVKIGIMGCIVNGPGEMADADFGYVGAGPGRVNLYVGRTLVVRNVPSEEADSRLVELIREHGRWRDPESSTASHD